MIQQAKNIPNVCHRWAREICAWAVGKPVQWRYTPPKEQHLMLKPDETSWRDCDYPSRGMPNWYNPGLEFRLAPLCKHDWVTTVQDRYRHCSNCDTSEVKECVQSESITTVTSTAGLSSNAS